MGPIGPEGPRGPTGPPGPPGEFVRTIVVSPVDGDSLKSGDALLAAPASITDASQTNPYLVWIEPGRYDLQSSTRSTKEWVDLQGSGESMTILRGVDVQDPNPVVVVVPNSEVRFLRIESTRLPLEMIGEGSTPGAASG